MAPFARLTAHWSWRSLLIPCICPVAINRVSRPVFRAFMQSGGIRLQTMQIMLISWRQWLIYNYLLFCAEFAPASFGTEFNIVPVTWPFFSPRKWTFAGQADFFIQLWLFDHSTFFMGIWHQTVKIKMALSHPHIEGCSFQSMFEWATILCILSSSGRADRWNHTARWSQWSGPWAKDK